jgi:3-hydroxyacyl-CoA dehydrogenase/enoyl-CoA hydratase/3-hydroxybutyryl-CoA epimerase
MSEEPPVDDLIRAELDADGVLVATIDMPGRTMNVFSADLIDALEALVDRVESDPAVRSCVVTSGKSSFLAGADLVMVRGFCDEARSATHAAMFERCGRLGRLFVRLEESPKPWVAAVNGVALGGGLELALACRVRLVADAPRLQLGVPEVRWGLLPGAGGTQRLPRLAGFEPALDLLLSGRSIDPATAVRLGLFERTLPAERLVDEARATARALHGQPYVAAAKFAHAAQPDVPPHDAAVARSIALRHGVTPADFDCYPAYSAIVDSVLKGARLPLAEATSIEMDQFLRLMFSPVAGRMVRTLFLERLRAERELAPPADVAIERLAVGAITPARRSWAEALGKSKLPLAVDPALDDDTLEIVDRRGARHRVALRVLDDEAMAPPSSTPSASIACAVLAPAGPYGRVLEIVGAAEAEAAALGALAQRLGSLPWRTPGPHSVLQRLRRAPDDAQPRIALLERARAGAGDLAFIDVAACLAGVTPAWTGGPLTRLWSERARIVPGLDAQERAAWTTLEPALDRALG